MNLFGHRRSVVVGFLLVSMAALALPITAGASGSLSYVKYGTAATAAAKGLAVNPAAPKSGNGGKTAQGVTSTSITVGELMSIAGPTPGVFNDVYESAEAYAAYVNSLGGVYGRKIHVTVGTDSYTVSKAQAACAKLIPSSFAIVGSYSFGESGCEPQVKSSGEPFVSSIVYTAKLYTLPNVITEKPDQYSNLEQTIELKEHKGTKITKVWLCEVTAPGIAAQAAPEIAVWKSLGVTAVTIPPIPANATTYTAEVVAAKDDGAQAVDCFSTPATVDAGIAKAAAAQDWHPAIARGYAVYSPTFVKLAGTAGKGWSTSVTVPYLTLKLFRSSAGGKLYSKWFKHVAGKTAPFEIAGTSGWIEMALFVQGLVRTGPDLTWPKFLKVMHSKDFTGYTADGVSPPYHQVGTDPVPEECLSITEDTGSSLKILFTKPNELTCGGQLFTG